ncbi:MAG: hypothetical protein JW719_03565 [Pirellulales bacterium]|nr:hypothetical protein [Pirellulales bacterium]
MIALLAIISGVGEGLHWIPGCGHGVWVGDSVVWLGVDVPAAQCPTDGRPGMDRPSSSRDIPIYDEDQCAICSAVARSCATVDSAPLVLAAPLVQDLSPAPSCILHTANVRPAQARSPPLA